MRILNFKQVSKGGTARWSSHFGVPPNKPKLELRLVALVLLMGLRAIAETTNNTSGPNSPPAATNAPVNVAEPVAPSPSAQGKLDESAFRIISERNIFNANRSGGTVRAPSSQRPARVETFTLVGTMAYEKGAFAFFEGSSSEFTKAIKPDGLIAGHKVLDIYTSAVKLEADGREIELVIGSQMRREDEGTWHVSESQNGNGASGNYAATSNRDRDYPSRSSRSGRYDNSRSRRSDSGSNRTNGSEKQSSAAGGSSAPAGDATEILKRLMERREKESK